MSGELDECRFRLLGPVQVMTTYGPVRFSRRQQLDLLALLLLHADRVLSVDMVVDAMWGQAAPRTATAQIKNMVSVLRRTLVDGHQILASIDRQVAGYRLHVTDGQLDLDRFSVLLAETKAAATPGTVASKLRRALGLWRGAHALAGVRADYADAARTHLQEMRSAALEDLFDAELECANHARIVPELTRAVEDHPGRERLVGQLMVALYRTGRTADALGVYRKARQVLTDEYGLEPSTGLRDLEGQILRGEPVPGRPRSISVGISIADQLSTGADTVPLQLPLDVFGFVGRHVELATLDRLLDDQRRQPRTVVISAVGMPGVGKTALAVHWAHRVADRFPDGQLYVNLRGFGPGSPISPAEAVRGFLDALAVAPKRVPVGVSAQAAHFRSLVAGRRMLVVLDNAASADQVRPLLPGTPSCLVLVTSRSRLLGLVVSESAVPITLDPLNEAEARELLVARLGTERVAAENRAAAELAIQCARLPLALAVVAARAAVHPTFPLARLSADLSDARGALGALTDQDASSDIRTVFSWSYDRLSDGAARLFRLLGLHGGPDIGASAAASLAGVPATEVVTLLAELSDAHLVNEYSPGRFTMHDLLRAYAMELTRTVDAEEDRRAATCRMLNHYLHTASAAAFLLNPHRYQIPLVPVGTGAIVETFTDHEHALEWYRTEHRVLVAAVELAAAGDLSAHAWQLASTIMIFFEQQCHWHDWASSLRSALAVAERVADRVGQAQAHVGLGIVLSRLRDFDLAYVHLRCALELLGDLGDQVGQANTHLRLCEVREGRGADAEALHHAEQALALHRAAGHRPGQAFALNNIGWYHAKLGQYEEAIASCEQAIALHRERGDQQGVAHTLDSLGYAYHGLGRHRRAAMAYRQSIELLREAGDRYTEAIVLVHLGDTHGAAGEADLARDAWCAALAILDASNHPDADQVRAKIGRLSEPRIVARV